MRCHGPHPSSVDPSNYPDALTEAIRRVLEVAGVRLNPVGSMPDGSRICRQFTSAEVLTGCRKHATRVPAVCRIGTTDTVATNALLERKGEKFSFLTMTGMSSRRPVFSSTL